jgi:hypothetical protein
MISRFPMRALLVVFCLIAPLAAAQVAIEQAWVRATVSGQRATGAFMTLTSKSAVTLVEARSAVAGVTEIHEMKMDKGMMQMQAVPGLPLAASKPLQLKPGGYHVMLMDLKQQVKAGDSVPITLVFEGADKKRFTQEVKVAARALGKE